MKLFTRATLETLSATVQSNIKEAIGEIVINGYDEKGNFAFVTESLSQTKLYKRVNETLYIECSFAAENYPSFSVNVLEGSEDEFKHYICTELGGWIVRKCQFSDIVADGEVICLVGYQIQNEADENFEQDSLEPIESFDAAQQMLLRAKEQLPESQWKLIPVDQDSI
tara:strand:+ start:15201 stop:15704 length:504 start_codon:yes stop_codon:yes gene_type:complete